MGKASIQVDLALLKKVLVLPESYEITHVLPSDHPQIALFIVESEDIPNRPGPDGIHVPQVSLPYTVDYHPDDHEFKRITVRAEIGETA